LQQFAQTSASLQTYLQSFASFCNVLFYFTPADGFTFWSIL